MFVYSKVINDSEKFVTKASGTAITSTVYFYTPDKTKAQLFTEVDTVLESKGYTKKMYMM